MTELGTALSIAPSVVPVDRYATLGPDVTTVPVFREGSTTQPGQPRSTSSASTPASSRHFPAGAADFSATPVDELAARLTSTRRRVAGLSPDTSSRRDRRMLDLRFRYSGEPLRLDAIVWTDDGDTVRIPLGTVRDGMTRATAPLPRSARSAAC